MATSNTNATAAAFNALRNRVINVLGTGSGNSGYGQSLSIPVATAASTDTLASMMGPIRLAINHARAHQTGGIYYSAAELPVVSKDTDMSAAVFQAYENRASEITNNRLAFGQASMTVYGTAHYVRRNSEWGRGMSGWNQINVPMIACNVNAMWSSDDRVRWFFNSGGDIRIVPHQPPGGNFGSNAWSNALQKIGTVHFSHDRTTRSGYAGTPNNVGYYSLGGDWSLIFNGTNIDNPYWAGYTHLDHVYIYARRIHNGVSFRVEYHESNMNQVIAPGAQAAFSIRLATQYLNTPNIIPPSFYTEINF